MFRRAFKVLSTLLVFIFSLAVLALAFVAKDHQNVPSRPDYQPSSPLTAVNLIPEKDSQPAATLEFGRLTVSLNLDPWLLTESTARDYFLMKARYDFFPKVFRGSQIKEACLEGIGTLRDVQGNRSRGKLILVCLTSMNAKRVDWQNVYTDDLVKFANEVWLHPGFRLSTSER